jgi:hypothetical protein
MPTQLTMQQIQLTCEHCKKVYDLDKSSELPAHVFFLHCNFCPECEDSAKGYYEEWWDEDENNPDTHKPVPVGDNQLCMPFLFDEIGVQQVSLVHLNNF